MLPYKNRIGFVCDNQSISSFLASAFLAFAPGSVISGVAIGLGFGSGFGWPLGFGSPLGFGAILFYTSTNAVFHNTRLYKPSFPKDGLDDRNHVSGYVERLKYVADLVEMPYTVRV